MSDLKRDNCGRKLPPGVARPHELSFDGEGELATCSVCGASEGELLLSCPGYRLDASALEACYRGNVVDFLARRRLADYRRLLLED